VITDLTYDEMTAMTKSHVCGQCDGILSVAWSAEKNGYILRCKDITHDKIVSKYHQRKTDRQIQDERIWKEINKVDTVSLTKMDQNTMLARVSMAKFPQDLTPADKTLLAEVARTYGLDPLMNEVSIYQGRPYVSIDGRYRMAQDTNQLDGVETRPATKQERADWQIPEHDYFFRSEVFKKGSSRPFVGWGRVLISETEGGKGFKPIEKNPQRMAEKRAEAQALRKAFHIPLPSLEDIGYRDGHVVDTSSGEILDVKATAVEEKTQEKPSPTPETTPANVNPQPVENEVTEPLKLDAKGRIEGTPWTPKIALSWLKTKPFLMQFPEDATLEEVIGHMTVAQRNAWENKLKELRELNK
jgi:hypothetical protein